MEMTTFIHQYFTHILNREQDRMPFCISKHTTDTPIKNKSITNTYMILCSSDSMLRHCSWSYRGSAAKHQGQISTKNPALTSQSISLFTQ